MLTLESVQQTVARTILGKPLFGLSPLFSAGRADPYRLRGVDQNNTRASLTSTLMRIYPVTSRLVDERFFRHAASEFIRFHPQSEYGSEFPNFLRTFDGLWEMPFVAETARLEWAIAEGLDEASLAPIAIAALDGVGEATPRLRLQPSLRFVISHWPVLSIWSAHQEGGDAASVRASQRKAERVAVWRAGENVRFSLLTSAEYSFRYSLNAGLGVEKAVSRAFTHDPMFDLATALVRLFGDGLVTEVGAELSH